MSKNVNLGKILHQFHPSPTQQLAKSRLYAVLPLHFSCHLQAGFGPALEANRVKIAGIVGQGNLPWEQVEEAARHKLQSGGLKHVTSEQVNDELKRLHQLTLREFPSYEG